MDQTVEELKNQLLSEVISEHREKLGMTLEELQGICSCITEM